MKITAFSKSRKPEVSVHSSSIEHAAQYAVALATKHAFVKVEYGSWNVVFSRHTTPSVARLAHIIETRAPIVFN